MATVEDLARLKASHPMLDAVIDEQEGRRIRIGDRWLFDFASLQLPGLRPRSGDHRRGPRVPREVGHPPVLVPAAREPRAVRTDRGDQLTALLGSEDTLLLPTITHIHMSVIPILVGSGRAVPGRPGAQDDLRRRDASPAGTARRSSASGTTTPSTSSSSSRRRATTPRVIAIDGVNSMTGNAPDVQGVRAHRPRERRAPVRRRRPRVRRRSASAPPTSCASGALRGNGVVRHQGETLRQHHPGRRVQQGVQLAAVVPRAALAAEGRPEGRGAAVPVLGALAGRVARDDDRRPRGERPPRRPVPLRDLPQDPHGHGTAPRARHLHAERVRLSR